MEPAQQQAQPEVVSMRSPEPPSPGPAAAKQPQRQRSGSCGWLAAASAALIVAGLSATLLPCRPTHIFGWVAPAGLESEPSPVQILRNELQFSRPQAQSYSIHASLGRIFLGDGRLSEAAAHFNEALVVADSNANQVEARLLLALARRHQGRLGDAREILKAALDFADSDSEGGVLHALAEVRVELGHFEAAIKLYNRAWGFLDQNDAEGVAVLAADIADAWAGKGHVQESTSWHGTAERALEFSRYGMSGADEEVAAKVHRRLGAAQLRLGALPAALEAYHRSLRVQRRRLHALHPELVSARLGAACALHGLGDSAGALLDVERVEESLRNGAQQNLDLSRALLAKAEILSDINRIDSAEKAVQEALRLQAAVLQDQPHPETAAALSRYGSILRASGRPGEARQQYSTALEISRETVGETHPATATLYKKLGTLEEGLGNGAAARDHFYMRLEIHVESFGAGSPSTVLAYVDLATFLSRQGQQQEAAKVLEDALQKLDDENLPQEHQARAEYQEALSMVHSSSVD